MWENSQTPAQIVSTRSARTAGHGAESRALTALGRWASSGREWPHRNAAAGPWEMGSR